MRLNLVIDTQCKRILFAEANNDFVGFVDFLLRSKNTSFSRKTGLAQIKRRCAEALSSRCYVPYDETMRRPLHFRGMSYVLEYVSRDDDQNRPNTDKLSVPFVVMDNLKVKDNVRFSTFFRLVRKFKVGEVAIVKNKVVGKDEALAMLEASRNSQTVLTDVFLKNKELGYEDAIFWKIISEHRKLKKSSDHANKGFSQYPKLRKKEKKNSDHGEGFSQYPKLKNSGYIEGSFGYSNQFFLKSSDNVEGSYGYSKQFLLTSSEGLNDAEGLSKQLCLLEY